MYHWGGDSHVSLEGEGRGGETGALLLPQLHESHLSYLADREIGKLHRGIISLHWSLRKQRKLNNGHLPTQQKRKNPGHRASLRGRTAG